MRHLNYNHLLYFWTVAREGSIAKASKVLHLTPQTISGQLKLLEDAIGGTLFSRVGRGLALTETGKMVADYAGEIFNTGAELAQRVRGRQSGKPEHLHVGIVDSIPKLIAHRILEPAFSGDTPIQLNCQEAALEYLLADLAVHKLDMVISDRPLPPGLNIKAYTHPLGMSRIGIFAHRQLAGRYRKNFPCSLHNAPFLLPSNSSVLRRSLDDWFEAGGISLQIVAECEDSALLKAFGAAGAGVYPAPMAIASEVERMYQSRLIGEVDGLVESYYAISPERKLKHPSVVTITEAARSDLFAD